MTNVGLKLVRGTDGYCDQDKGHICSQVPKADTDVDKGQSITVVVSKGARPISVPDETGKSADDAKQDLQAKGFTNVTTKQDDGNSGKDPGTVLSQNPDAGRRIGKGTKITLTVAASIQQVAVPNVVTEDFNTAQAQLTALGFKVVQNQTPNAAAPGTVLSQDPAANSQADKGSTITLSVAQAQSAGTLPADIVGKTAQRRAGRTPGDGADRPGRRRQPDRRERLRHRQQPGAQQPGDRGPDHHRADHRRARRWWGKRRRGRLHRRPGIAPGT